MHMRRYILLCAILSALVTPLSAQEPAKSTHKKLLVRGKTGASPAAIKAGEAVFTRYCSLCHLNASTEKKIGPGLKGLGKRKTFASGEKITDESLRTWIENGSKTMPGFKQTLSPEEMHNVVAYIKSL
ncbi:MAG: cytochrome c [Acidipila sp.]|nr:cytochrome c [Acidipila sp.]